MTIKLDASHQSVLEHWETITQMKDCCAQVERSLMKVARKILSTLHQSNRNHFEPDEAIEKDGWLSLNPNRFLKWKDSGAPLLAFGVEYISVEGVLHLGSESPCSSYVYSPYRADKAINDSSTDQLVSIVPPPSGFEQTFDIPNRGYIFQKVLPALTPKEFCNPTKLEQHLTDPLVTLIEWYKANEGTIQKAFGASRREKSSI